MLNSMKKSWVMPVVCMLLGMTRTYGLAPLAAFSVGSEVYEYIKNHKAPVRIAGIMGAMPHEYGVVETIIKFNPSDKTVPQGSLGSPVITRTFLGKIGPVNPALLLGTKLEVPSQALDLTSAMYNLPDIVTKAAGAVDPRAGAVAALVGATVEMASQIATEQINKLFGTNETTLTVLDIFPIKYYFFNETTKQFELKPQFKSDLEKYANIINNVLPKAAAFNAANKEYTQARAGYLKTYKTVGLPEDASQAQIRDYETVLDSYKKLADGFRAMAGELFEMERYGMHRISIMAANLKPGELCSRLGDGWHGPFRLWVYYYLGAKLTNVFSADFCVHTKQKVQDLMVKVTPNTVDKYGNLIRGGVQFVGVNKSGSSLTQCKDNECIVGFPTIEGGSIKALPVSPVYSWWDSAITSDDAGMGLAQYLLPCDLNKLAQSYKDIRDEKRKAIADDALKAVEMLKSALSKKDVQQQLLDPNQTGTGSSPVPKGAPMGDILDVVGKVAGGGGQSKSAPVPAPKPEKKEEDIPVIDF
jgi:hypothetical protein